MNIDPAVVMAIGGLVTGVGGLLLSRRGQEATSRQAEAAGRLQARIQTVDELEGLADRRLADAEAARAETDRAYRARDEARADAERERTRRVDAETALRLCEAQTTRALEAQRTALSDLAALRLIVQDEIAKAATDEAWGRPRDPTD